MSKHLPTGAGRIRVENSAPAGGVRATLGNFDIDSDVLKPEHTAFLRTRVLPIFSARQARIWLQGSASSTGSDAHNLSLSRRRAESVASLLKASGVSGTQVSIEAVGEGLATTTPAENADDRSVSLLAARLAMPPPPAPARPKPADAPRSTKFKIRLLGGLSAGVGPAGIEQLYFQIWDQWRGVTSFYIYTAGGFGRGGMLISATLEGPWNDFVTTAPVAVDEFGGAARFTTAGAGPFTFNYLSMLSIARGAATNPTPLVLSTGFTVGVGASTSAGNLQLGPTLPFSGP